MTIESTPCICGHDRTDHEGAGECRAHMGNGNWCRCTYFAPVQSTPCPFHGPDCVADPREGQDFDFDRQAPAPGDRQQCGHDIHVLYRTSPDTAVRLGICVDEIGPLQFDVYGRKCGVNGDPVTTEINGRRTDADL